MDEIQYSEFENPSFDAKELVQRYRKRIPLPHLQKILRGHHAATRQELIELINEKYADFVSLSSRMQGVERALKPLRAPLEESSELTKGLHTKLGGLLQKAEEAHQGLARIQARKAALNAYIENARLLQKIQCSTGQKWSNPQESDDFFRDRITQECIARDLRRVRLNLEGASAEGDAPECKALLDEALAFQEDFSKRLQEKLRLLLSASKKGWEASQGDSAADRRIPRSELVAVAHTCKALCTIGHSEPVEQIFAEVFAKAALEEISVACSAAAEEAKRKAMAETSGAKMVAGAVDLAVFFQSVAKAFFTEESALLGFAQRLRRGSDGDEALAVPSLKLVAYSVVLPALRQVQEVWPNVFMPAFPDTFAANYVHFTKFLQAAEEVMDTSEAQVLRRDPALCDFQRKWKTQVYCSLRTKEAAQLMDAAARRLATSEPAQHKAAGGFWLEVSSELARTIDLVWSAWYLSSLFPKMARLSLELLARYGKLLSGFAETSSTAGLGWDAGASPPGWNTSSQPVRLARAASDVLQVMHSLQVDGAGAGTIAKLFLDRLPADEKPKQLTQALLADSAEGLRPTLALLKDEMLKQVVAAMVTHFAAIRGIPAFYRMLNKPVPTKASPYVESSLRPLTAFREVLVGSAIRDTEIISSWLKEMVDGASQEFTSQAAQLIELTRQQEASLRRLAGRGSGGEEQVSDLDKIHMQLCLDVDTFSQMAAETVGGSTEGLSKLIEAVSGIRRDKPP